MLSGLRSLHIIYVARDRVLDETVFAQDVATWSFACGRQLSDSFDEFRNDRDEHDEHDAENVDVANVAAVVIVASAVRPVALESRKARRRDERRS